jgi:hypothetical protein
MGAESPEVLGDRFYDLLEASAEEAGHSVRLLAGFLKVRSDSTEDLAAVRRKSEQIAAEIGSTLARTIMAGLQRDDIQGLSRVLRTIPERVEKLAGRHLLARDRLADLDFSPPVEPLGTAVETLDAMVHQLRAFANLETTQPLNSRLQDAADRAETLLEGVVREVYRRQDDPLKLVIVKDLADQIQSIIDACRDAGNLVLRVVLKYA